MAITTWRDKQRAKDQDMTEKMAKLRALAEAQGRANRNRPENVHRAMFGGRKN